MVGFWGVGVGFGFRALGLTKGLGRLELIQQVAFRTQVAKILDIPFTDSLWVHVVPQARVRAWSGNNTGHA